MKFKITKTSHHRNDDICPYKGAVKEPCLSVDERTFKSPEEHDAKLCGPGSKTKPWLKEGLNHRKVPGGIARDFPTTAWFIEIENLEGLMKFASKVGNLVIDPDCSWAKGFPEIEIYNDYRE